VSCSRRKRAASWDRLMSHLFSPEDLPHFLRLRGIWFVLLQLTVIRIE
jgi:hypothetical protein